MRPPTLQSLGRGLLGGLRASAPSSARSALSLDLMGASRGLAVGKGAPKRGGHRGEARKKHNFWAKWTERSQQAFWQDVAFAQDRPYEVRSRPTMLKDKSLRQEAQDERELLAEEPNVVRVENAPQNEGGEGCTVAYLR